MHEYDDCTFCGGRVTERRVQKGCWWGDKLTAIVDNVPTGVCEQCGERYYKVHVLKQIDEMLSTRKGFERIEIPVAQYRETG